MNSNAHEQLGYYVGALVALSGVEWQGHVIKMLLNLILLCSKHLLSFMTMIEKDT